VSRFKGDAIVVKTRSHRLLACPPVETRNSGSNVANRQRRCSASDAIKTLNERHNVQRMVPNMIGIDCDCMHAVIGEDDIIIQSSMCCVCTRTMKFLLGTAALFTCF